MFRPCDRNLLPEEDVIDDLDDEDPTDPSVPGDLWFRDASGHPGGTPRVRMCDEGVVY
ncbi:MAG: hypothetical protein U0031_15585 [Thermomicrobiales bacterium]